MILQVPGGNGAGNGEGAADAADGQNPADPAAANPHEAANQGDEVELEDDDEDVDGEEDEDEDDEELREEEGADANNGGQGQYQITRIQILRSRLGKYSEMFVPPCNKKKIKLALTTKNPLLKGQQIHVL